MIGKYINTGDRLLDNALIAILSTLLGIFANGQLFHPRTKIVMPLSVVTQVDGIQKFLLRDDIGLLITAQDPLAQEAQYLGLLAKNVVMLADCTQGVSYSVDTLKTNMQSVQAQLLQQ